MSLEAIGDTIGPAALLDPTAGQFETLPTSYKRIVVCDYQDGCLAAMLERADGDLEVTHGGFPSEVTRMILDGTLPVQAGRCTEHGSDAAANSIPVDLSVVGRDLSMTGEEFRLPCTACEVVGRQYASGMRICPLVAKRTVGRLALEVPSGVSPSTVVTERAVDPNVAAAAKDECDYRKIEFISMKRGYGDRFSV